MNVLGLPDIEALCRSLEQWIGRRKVIPSRDRVNALNVLAIVPSLARDEKIRDLLLELACSGSQKLRSTSAALLARCGDPAGILHLVYNSLHTHPLLKRVQSAESGWWSDMPVRFIDLLTDKCIELLLDDLPDCGPYAFHGYTLAFLRNERILPRLTSLFDSTNDRVKRHAAFALAFHGYAPALDVLAEWARTDEWPILPLEAIARLGTGEALSVLSEFSVPTHPIYRSNHQLSQRCKDVLLPMVRLWLELRQTLGPMPMHKVMERHFFRRYEEIPCHSRGKSREKISHKLRAPVELFVMNNWSADRIWLPAQNILASFADPQDLASISDLQAENVTRLFEENGLTSEDLLDGARCDFFSGHCLRPTGLEPESQEFYNSAAFQVYYDRDDYLKAATDWIRHPNFHRRPS